MLVFSVSVGVGYLVYRIVDLGGGRGEDGPSWCGIEDFFFQSLFFFLFLRVRVRARERVGGGFWGKKEGEKKKGMGKRWE